MSERPILRQSGLIRSELTGWADCGSRCVFKNTVSVYDCVSQEMYEESVSTL